MRVLILSAILACACAAPSAPILAIAPIVPAAIPTLSPGDLQAAAIDAKVKAEDEARALADQARLAADAAREQAELAILEDQKQKAEEANSQAKEKNEELFWNVEDKKWQAIDAVKTIEAKLDGAVAGNADALAKSVIAPLTAVPYTNLVYTGLIPLTGIKEEKLVKTAEPEKAESESKDKTELPKVEGIALASQPVPAFGIIGAPFVQAPIALYQPGLLGAPLPLQPVLTPLIKPF